jgi:hypothetical protein
VAIKKSLNEITRYRSFIIERDAALDKIYLNTQRRISDHLRESFGNLLTVALSFYRLAHAEKENLFRVRQIIKSFEKTAHVYLISSTPKILADVSRMRRSAYLLSFAGEAEAIGRAMGQITKSRPNHAKYFDYMQKTDYELRGRFSVKIDFAFNKIIRDVISAFEFSIIGGLDVDSAMFNMYKKLPRTRLISKTEKKLNNKQLKEAEQYSFGAVTSPEWQDIVDDYMKEYIPKSRGPEWVVDRVPSKSALKTEREVYAWEVERDVTDMYVRDTLTASKDSGNENGINDFLWLAIIDDRTSDCCLDRDGLTTREIEEKLNSGEMDDECQAITPPAHFNCRCRIAPIVGEAPEKITDELKDFSEWLKQVERA